MFKALLPLLLCYTIASEINAATASTEEKIFRLAEQSQFMKIETLLKSLPKSSPYPKLVSKTLTQLKAAKETVIKNINLGVPDLTLRKLNPDSIIDGVISGASRTQLKVTTDQRTRRLIFSGLPTISQHNLFKLALTDELKSGAISELLLAEIFNQPNSISTTHPIQFKNINLTQAMRHALSKGHVSEAERFGNQLTEPLSAWSKITSHWSKRLRTALHDREARALKFKNSMPANTKIFLWWDFEEGADLIPSMWQRGLSTSPPNPSKTNQWCRSSVMVGKGMHWGEIIDEFESDVPICNLEKGLKLSFKVWPKNVDTIYIKLDSLGPRANRRSSAIPIRLKNLNGWNECSMALDKFQRHRRNPTGGFPIMRMNTPIRKIYFTASRKNIRMPNGQFYIDDFCLFKSLKITHDPPKVPINSADNDEDEF